MSQFFHSLRFRILIIAILSFALLFALVIYNTTRLLNSVAEENILSNIRQTSETMNLAISMYTSKEDLDTLNEYIQELISGSEVGIVYLAITDDLEQVVLKTTDAPSKIPAPTLREDYLTEKTIHIAQPTLLQGSKVGTLRFGMTWQQLHTGLERVKTEIFLLLSAGFILIIVLVLFLGMRLNHRVADMMITSQRLGSGEYGVRVNESGRDELSALAINMNAMAQAIEDRIADLEKSREEIQGLNASLEQRVIERTSELAMALSDLEKTQKELVQSEKLAGLGSIVAAVAHELNTPIGNALTVSTSFADKARNFENEIQHGLKRSTLNAFQNDVKSAVELIERNLGKASELITSFKHVAIDQTSSKRREFELAQTLNEVISTIRPTFKKTGHVLETEMEPGIMMDSFPGPIGQIVTNFVNNAVLHAFKDIDAGVMRLSCMHDDKGWVRIIFSDNGVGMSDENLKQIFDPFFTTQLGQGGSGLGLHIVHNMVTGLLGGTIQVQSTRGKGSIFNIRLPLKAPQQNENKEEQEDYFKVKNS